MVSKVCHRPAFVVPTWLEIRSFFIQGYNFFLFFISYLYDAKNMLPGLSFFCGCLQNRRAKRIYLPDPSHKDNEAQNSGVQLGTTEGGAPPPILRPPSKDRIMLQVREPLLLSGSTLCASLKSRCMCVVCRDYCMSELYRRLVLTSRGSGF